MLKATTILCAGALGLALSGCTLFRSHAALARAEQARAARDIPYDGRFEYAFGRTALLEGRYATAIQSLRRSELYPDYRAASANGLAIAYSALGRDDVALHYFRKAAGEQPDAARYRANLAAHEARMARAEQVQREQQARAAPPPPVERSTVVRIVTAGDGSWSVLPDSNARVGLLRLSQREVRIVDEQMTPRTAEPGLALAAAARKVAR